MKQNVWILNHYAGSMMINKGGRHYWFAKYLKKEGYNPVIFASNSKHGIKEQWFETNKLWIEKKAEEIDTPFIFVKTPLYSCNGIDRIINMFAFYINVKKVAKEYAENHDKPDIIYASSVHPLTLVAGIKLAKYFNVKCICEVRDLWPEAIVAYSKKITKSSLIAKLLYAGEKWIYKKSDALVFTQEGGLDYIKEHGWDKEHGGPINVNKVHHINNGVDLEAFDGNIAKFSYSDEDLDNTNFFKVVYCGAIRKANNLGLILDAAKLITNPKIRFIIFGSGEELNMLKQRLEEEKINNVFFKGHVNKQFIPNIDSKSDLNLVHYEVSSYLRYGESHNKSFEYFAAGKPIFYTERPGYSIVEKYHGGRISEGYNAKDIASGIETMAEMSEVEKKEISKNARKTAEIYDFKEHTKKLISIIESL